MEDNDLTIKDITDARRQSNGAQSAGQDLLDLARQYAEPGGNRSRAGLIAADSITSKQVEFLDNTERFPIGHVTMLAGDGGLGKSLLVIREAAIVSCRGDGVIFSSAEDDRSSTWRPRLEAQKAELPNVQLLRVSRSQDGLHWDEPPLIPGELSRFRVAIEEMNAKLAPHQVRLLVIDPLEAHLDDPRDDGNSSVARRRALGALEALASEYGLAVIVVHHISKDSSQRARHRVLGTVANRNAVRSLIFFANDPDEQHEPRVRRIEFHEKANLSLLSPPRLYEIITVPVPGPRGEMQVPRLEYHGNIEADLERAMGVPRSDEERTELDETRERIRELLVDGREMRSTELERDLRENLLVSVRTIERARKAEGVKAKRVEFGSKGHWMVYIPGSEIETHQTPPPSGGLGGVRDFVTDLSPPIPKDDPRIQAILDQDRQEPPTVTLGGLGGVEEDFVTALEAIAERVMDCPRCGPRAPKTIVAGLAYCECGEKVPWEQ